MVTFPSWTPGYRAAFESGDVGGVVHCCRCPVQNIGSAQPCPSVSVAEQADWPALVPTPARVAPAAGVDQRCDGAGFGCPSWDALATTRFGGAARHRSDPISRQHLVLALR